MNHSEAVTERYLTAKNRIENNDTFWDEVYKEEEYFENEESPHPPHPDDKGNVVGEFDTLLVNYDEQVALYEEVKTSHGDMYYAKNQMERAEEHFEDTEWEIITNRVLHD